jgi:spore germination protein YaaH
LPVADPAWADKVIQEALKSISKKKLVLGIPTYGYLFQTGIVDPGQSSSTVSGQPTSIDSAVGNSNSDQPFKDAVWSRIRSLTFAQAMQLASSTGSTPVRNSAGELSFAYATTSPSTGNNVARVAWFPDAQSIARNIALAKKYHLKGVYIFKFDGEADQSFWNLLPNVTSAKK